METRFRYIGAICAALLITGLIIVLWQWIVVVCLMLFPLLLLGVIIWLLQGPFYNPFDPD